MDDQIVIFKNEKIGDLIHSVNSIKKIILKYPNNKINIFLSHYNSEMKFLFISDNVVFHIISEKINILDKIKILKFFFTKRIKETYIFKPSNFLFFLPFLFYLKKIRFLAICVDNYQYHRPNLFLRKFLNKFVINDRSSRNIRKSISNLHLDLALEQENSNFIFSSLKKNIIDNDILDNYVLIHFNKSKFLSVNWEINDLFTIVNELKNYYKKIVITNDLNDIESNEKITAKYKKDKKKVIYYPNIMGKSFFDLIGNAKIIISFHGMITSIGAIQNTPVLDLFNCTIKNKNDFYKYKNAFHEFKPKLNNYEFIIPRENLLLTINRIKHLITYGRKFNN